MTPSAPIANNRFGRPLAVATRTLPPPKPKRIEMGAIKVHHRGANSVYSAEVFDVTPVGEEQDR